MQILLVNSTSRDEFLTTCLASHSNIVAVPDFNHNQASEKAPYQKYYKSTELHLFFMQITFSPFHLNFLLTTDITPVSELYHQCNDIRMALFTHLSAGSNKFNLQYCTWAQLVPFLRYLSEFARKQK